ncbi:expressed unknown protein [Seminavis robusta]|uniref:Uncharacterized protein n=1 Tax=Seminavis robusta TaxID=568900 RepID=A0A9N8DG33_9STRA|nr:expressed unknown protein [Seminavis robusta]|eukprot:Sro74_g040840.1 n/a (466) ;mRNA; r:87606-89003
MNDVYLHADTDMSRFYPKENDPWYNAKWTEQRASTVKGETEDMFEHAKKIGSRGMNTSIDAPWWVHQGWRITDVYTILIMALFLVPLMLVLWLPLFFCLLPPVMLLRLYVGWRLPQPTHQIPRQSIEWKFHVLVQLVLCIPAFLLAMFVLAYSHVVMTIFGGLYLTSSAIVQCKPYLLVERLRHNNTVLKPYQGGPFLLWHIEDIMVAVAGSVYRQHFLEFMRTFTTMFFANPWMKYWVTANIYLSNLDERFLTQIGQSMADMNRDDIDTQVMHAISRAKNSESNRNELDAKTFAPHYPYPPPSRRYAIGMQHAGLITTLVHTTHYRSPPVANEGPVASLSNSAALPVYRVMLWRNNPYHIYTGYVEANLSSGFPTQPSKNLGGEHPMWLVNSHNKLAADRNLAYSLGAIDSFFDNYIPQLAHFVRLNVRGRAIADEHLKRDRRMGFEQIQNEKLALKYQRMAEC